jgi:hypothetical protein
MNSIQPGQPDDGSTRDLVASGIAQFAGVMLSIFGVLEILQGISAIARDNVFVRGPSYTYELDVTTWGWIHLVIGVVGIAIGIAIVSGRTVGYLVGIGVAFVAAVANFASMPYAPFWALVLIAFNVSVIWALCRRLGRRRVDDGFGAGQDVPIGSSTPTAAPEGPGEPRHPSPDAPSSLPR